MSAVLAVLAISVVAVVLLLAWLARSDRPAARIAAPALFGLAVLAWWELLVAGFDIPAVLLPPPSAIARAIGANLFTLSADFQQTVLRAALSGLLIGSAGGFAAAILLDRSPFLARGFLPLANLASALPIVGIAPIAVMWFGFDWQSKAAVVVLMTFFPMFVNTVAGLQAAGPLERDLLRSYGASYGQTLRLLRLPAALPHLFQALKLNAVLALTGAVVAEFFGTPVVGMGFRISTEAARMNLDVVWATITIVALTGSLSYAAIALAERRVTMRTQS